MRRFVHLFLAGAFLAVLGSCALFQSADGDILTFAMPGLVGTVTISPEAKTVTATVEPMSLANVTPTVTVSEKAELTSQPALADGQGVTYVVTAENGDAVSWTVTVTVQHGVSFTYDTTKVVLKAGLVDSSDAADNELYGNGVPPASYWPGDDNVVIGYGLLENYDYGGAPASIAQAGLAAWWGASTAGPGSFDQTNAAFSYYVPAAGATPAFELSAGLFTSGSTLSVVITVFGAVGGDIVGTFTATAVLSTDSTEHPVTAGFFKLKRMADNTIS